MVQFTELGNKSLLKVLNFFLRAPNIRISYSNLRRNLRIAKATVAKQLNFLLKEDFIKVEKIGLSKIYRLNRDNEIVKQLKILDNLFLIRSVKELCKKYNMEIYLYGSASRGEDTEESDFDLLIIGKMSREKIFDDLSIISKTIGREIKFSVYTKIGWSKMYKEDPAFYERVEKDKKRLH